MLKALTHELRLGVARDAISLVRVNRWRAASVEVLAEHRWKTESAQSESQALAALSQVLQQAFTGSKDTSLALHIVLADELTRIFHVTPPPGARKLSDLKAAAAMRFQTLYGEPLSGWQLQAQWSAEHAFLAVALPDSLLAALHHDAGASRPVAVSIAPHFIHAWNRYCRKLQAGAWFGVLQDGSLTLGVIDGGKLCTVRRIALPVAADAAGLKILLAREALLLDVSSPALVQLCGPVPPDWLRHAGVQGLENVQVLAPGQTLARRLALAGGTA